LEQNARHHDLGHLEDDRPAVADDLGADLHQPVAQRGHGPLPTSAGSVSVRRKLERLQAKACSFSRTVLALKQWHDSRVQMTAFLPSLIHMSNGLRPSESY
jgi:hypothetical protein